MWSALRATFIVMSQPLWTYLINDKLADRSKGGKNV